jgi:DNA-binding NarL/FixJ family response regulator
MPGLNGLEVARRLTQKYPELKIIMLTMHAEEPYVLEAVRAGALGYVRKEAGAEELVKAIRVVATGERYFSQPFSEQALKDYLARVGSTPGMVNPTDLLTNREREVLQLTVEGHTCADIAEKLFISARTVESHRANLMKKLGVKNQKDLIRFVMQHGLISGD